MPSLATQQQWNLALEQGRNASALETPPDAVEPPAQKTSAFNQIIQTATLQLLRSLALAGLSTFGFTWLLLALYTLIKDLSQFEFLADPGDLLFLFLPPAALQKIPSTVKSMPRLFSRLLIYPLGGFVLLAYLIVFIALLVFAAPFLAPWLALGSLLSS
ncbi:hypothetical protein HY628_00350 [Candidatus Uhrbacteria bacterium]|nr:hypothetical protein [Candidatus Uhrbacteria bacterium]